ncbi:hypothetical protein [Streptomyces althioticus]|uniref:hypothetical protein n=1 Tax=Streptomyces althioticus TaxID=83380 RepID=UPI0033CC4C0F
MFKVGDRVEVVTYDGFNGQFGELVEIHEEVNEAARVHLDRDKSIGYSPLWFDFSELRKVEA